MDAEKIADDAILAAAIATHPNLTEQGRKQIMDSYQALRNDCSRMASELIADNAKLATLQAEHARLQLECKGIVAEIYKSVPVMRELLTGLHVAGGILSEALTNMDDTDNEQ